MAELVDALDLGSSGATRGSSSLPFRTSFFRCNVKQIIEEGQLQLSVIFMQVSVESREGLERCITVELPAERVDREVEKRLKEIKRGARMDGFRPGKVPHSVICQRYGEQVRQEVFGELIQSSYPEALTQEDLNPAGEPVIEPLEKPDGEGMAYTAVFEVLPEITLGEMGEIKIKRSVVEVTDDDVAQMIEKLRQQRITWREVDRAAQDGDQVTINFKGLIEGDTFDGGSSDNVPLVLGSNTMIEGFEAGLIGVASGDDRRLELKFPEDYRVEDLAGKDVIFEIEAKQVAEPLIPEVDEAFFKAFGVSEGGIEGLSQEIRSNMERELSEKIQGLLKEQTLDALLKVNPINLPRVLVQKEARVLQEQTRSNMAQQGQPGNLDLPLELFEAQGEKRVLLGLIMAEVVKQQGIKLDADRVRARVEEFSRSYEQPEEVMDYYYSNREHLANVESVVIEDQVVDWVLDQVQVEEEVASFNDLMNPEQPVDAGR